MEPDAITVVIASYNHAAYVEEALRSTYGQTHSKISVIVTDDASKDDSQQVILNLLKVNGWTARTIFHDENRGLCATFNEALGAVDTPYVAFMSADDRMGSERLAKQVAALEEAGPEYALCHSEMRIIDEVGQPTGITFSDYVEGFRPPLAEPGAELVYKLLRGNWLGAPSVLLRTEKVREVGGYDESLWCEDYDLWLRLAPKFGFVYLEDKLVDYRKIGTAMTGDDTYKPWAQRDFLTIAPKHLGTSTKVDEFIRQRCFLLAKNLYSDGFIDRSQARRAMQPYLKATPSVGGLVDYFAVVSGGPRGLVRRWKP